MSHEQMLRAQNSARVYQQRYDDSLAPWNMRAPAMVLGEDVSTYRWKLARLAKKQLPEDHQLRQVQYRQLEKDAFDILEPRLLRAVSQEAYNPSNVPVGQFRIVPEVDVNGLKTNRFIGQESFVKQMGRPGRRVVSFMHCYDASGRALR
jgi:hypothetical protein